MGMRALLLGIRPCLSIGRGQPGGRRLFDVSWDEPHGSSSHEVDANLGLLGSLGIPSVAQVPRLVPHNAALQRVAGLAHERFASAEKFVVLFPGGAKPSQHWPVAHYSRLAEWLSRHNLGVCVIGSHVDASDARKIAESAGPKGWNLAGRLTLQEVIALLSLASCYVGNDSGPTHIAAALAVPCVALYRPSQVQKYHPRGSGLIRVLYSELPCSACEQINGRPHTCMEALSFETVRAAVRETVPHILP
jgi:ADP-heptose:LPS heptosyltransferase